MRGGRDLLGAVAGMMGAGLLARALYDAMPRPASAPITRRFRASVRVACPVDDCFAAWSEPANLPRFLSHLKGVSEFEDARLRFTVDAAGRDLDLDVILTRFEPPRVIAWRTLGGAPLSHSGLVTFAREGRRTVVSVLFTYATPPRQLRHLVTDVLGPLPQRRLELDLLRMKALLERP